MRLLVFKYLLISMRPQQWFKNFFIFAAVIFVREFYNIEKIAVSVAAFFIFCLASGAVYLFNDIIDLPLDRLHPSKKNRPLASGKIQPSFAILCALIFGAAATAVGLYLNYGFGLAVLGYLGLNIIYSLILKYIFIIDIIVVAMGFIIRVVAGALAIDAKISPWLLFCTFFLALFLAIGKRKSELLSAAGGSARPALANYSPAIIDKMNMVVLPSILIGYTLYTFNSEHSQLMMATVPVVLYGLFRYLFILEKKSVADDGPSDDLLNDRGLQATIAIWLAMVILILNYKQ